jgi:hypothetical protein
MASKGTFLWEELMEGGKLQAGSEKLLCATEMSRLGQAALRPGRPKFRHRGTQPEPWIAPQQARSLALVCGLSIKDQI